MKRDGSDRVRLLDYLGSPVGLTVDWAAEHLYWTDNKTNVIEVCKTDGGTRKIIISEGLSRPHAIDISPREGLLFWTDRGHKSMRIEKSYLDGSGRKPLYETPEFISSITVDINHGHLYFAITSPASEEGVSRLDYNAPLQVLYTFTVLLYTFTVQLYYCTPLLYYCTPFLYYCTSAGGS